MGESVLGLPAELVRRIATEVGTPVYVYSADLIRAQWRRLAEALAGVRHRILYSVKANSNLALLNLLHRMGAGADIVSGGELVRARRAGFEPADVVFSGVGKTGAELAAAIGWGVGLINLESRGEVREIARLTAASARPVRVGIRVNPDVTTDTHPYTQTAGRGMKFGVPTDQVVPLAREITAVPHLCLASIGMHLGSQIAHAEAFRQGAATLARLVDRLRAGGIGTLDSVDVGGGIAIDYGTAPGLEVGAFASAVAPLAEGTGLLLLVEPGRYLVGNAGALLTRVLYRKHSGGRDFLVVDAGMNDFLRPSHYGAIHDIRVVDRGDGEPQGDGTCVDVVGPICETGDFLGLARRLPGVGDGALLAICGAGAYGFSMSSTYNSRPRPAEVLTDGGRYGLVREREHPEDLWRGEVLEPGWKDWTDDVDT